MFGEMGWSLPLSQLTGKRCDFGCYHYRDLITSLNSPAAHRTKAMPPLHHLGSFLPGYLAPGILSSHRAHFFTHSSPRRMCTAYFIYFLDKPVPLLLFFSWFLPLSLSQVDLGGEVGLKGWRMAEGRVA